MSGNNKFNAGSYNATHAENFRLQYDAVIVFDKCPSVSETAKLYNRLMMLTSQGHDVILDCSQVTAFDTILLRWQCHYVPDKWKRFTCSLETPLSGLLQAC